MLLTDILKKCISYTHMTFLFQTFINNLASENENTIYISNHLHLVAFSRENFSYMTHDISQNHPNGQPYLLLLSTALLILLNGSSISQYIAGFNEMHLQKIYDY